MLISLIAFSAVFAAWALGAGRLERARLTAPIVLIVAGVAAGFTTSDALAVALNADVAQHGAEIILAVLLFVDATDVRGGLFGREPRAALRVLLLAMPLSLGLSVLLGAWMLPELSFAVLLVIACAVVPTDFAPAATILRDARVPERVRNVLNVEAGYNDGIVAPVFIFALAFAGDDVRTETPLRALGSAVPQALTAIVVGGAVGALLALAINGATRRGWMTGQSVRMILVTAPMLAYGLSLAFDGNGFVSAFVCGITFHYLRHSPSWHEELEFVDDIGFLLSAIMWFVVGAVAVLAVERGVSWQTVVFCLLALTLVRVVPVMLAMLRSRFSWRERMMLAWLGPRGTSTIVFGLLAYNVLDGADEHDVLAVMVVVVLGSVVIHGLIAPSAAARWSRTEN
ncbi:sodium:proton exchanger [Mycolicibacterium obuense]|uniref:Sodium:proton exchanger n=1 Tax=Mycolicibacterium obuense TaxID=1807 RepID=A0A4R5X1L0_9MYCO|nr:cation:proton antiporter [Mycolicibacterium obuense]OKH72705.1 sodium:proton exchanger [Mycobacterium sp. SWH-M1]TDL04223.1 sodium:proton exchanger [Mycolicibacterium obuense]